MASYSGLIIISPFELYPNAMKIVIISATKAQNQKKNKSKHTHTKTIILLPNSKLPKNPQKDAIAFAFLE